MAGMRLCRASSGSATRLTSLAWTRIGSTARSGRSSPRFGSADRVVLSIGLKWRQQPRTIRPATGVPRLISKGEGYGTKQTVRPYQAWSGLAHR